MRTKLSLFFLEVWAFIITRVKVKKVAALSVAEGVGTLRPSREMLPLDSRRNFGWLAGTVSD